MVCKKTSVLEVLPTVLKELGISRLLDMGKELKDNIQQYGKGRIHIEDSFDVFIDGVKVAEPKPKSGKIRISFRNPKHKPVTVKICFPIFAEIGIKEIRCNGETKAVNSGKEKMYFFGDSITQGFVAALHLIHIQQGWLMRLILMLLIRESEAIILWRNPWWGSKPCLNPN